MAVEECVTQDGDFPMYPCLASADSAAGRMTRRSLGGCAQIVSAPVGVVEYGYWGPRACPWCSIGIIAEPLESGLAMKHS